MVFCENFGPISLSLMHTYWRKYPYPAKDISNKCKILTQHNNSRAKHTFFVSISKHIFISILFYQLLQLACSQFQTFPERLFERMFIAAEVVLIFHVSPDISNYYLITYKYPPENFLLAHNINLQPQPLDKLQSFVVE